MHHLPSENLRALMSHYRWRVGRDTPLNIYAQPGPVPSENDPFIGVMFGSDDLARQVCKEHNDWLGIPGTTYRGGIVAEGCDWVEQKRREVAAAYYESSVEDWDEPR